MSRIENAVDDLDETVKQIRSAIFALETTRSAGPGLRDRVLTLCREFTGALGFEPRVFFDGPVDAAATDDLGADLLATLPEALSNVARHAHATRVEVSVVVDDEHLTVEVTDDGTGIPADSVGGGKGLANMAVRANRHDGEFEHRPGPSLGTTIVWRVPRV